MKRRYLYIAVGRKELKKYRIDINRFINAILVVLMAALLLYVGIDTCRFPEKYITTWRYQLQQDIEAGNEEAIEYYNNVYGEKRIELFK